jgi:hypothetical protein
MDDNFSIKSELWGKLTTVLLVGLIKTFQFCTQVGTAYVHTVWALRVGFEMAKNELV